MSDRLNEGGDMTERSYTTIDKSAWARGQWDNEPDKIQWLDGTTDLDCLIVRGPSGALCGYVGVGPDHPCHGADYNYVQIENADGELDYPDVHGGLTYADSCQEGGDESENICHVPLPGRTDDVWWFGFDCAHLGDITPKWLRENSLGRDETYKTVGYVRREVASLAGQLAGHCVKQTPSWLEDDDD